MGSYFLLCTLRMYEQSHVYPFGVSFRIIEKTKKLSTPARFRLEIFSLSLDSLSPLPGFLFVTWVVFANWQNAITCVCLVSPALKWNNIHEKQWKREFFGAALKYGDEWFDNSFAQTNNAVSSRRLSICTLDCREKMLVRVTIQISTRFECDSLEKSTTTFLTICDLNFNLVSCREYYYFQDDVIMLF